MHFKTKLTLISVAVVVGFFSIGYYNGWLRGTLLYSLNEIPDQMQHQTLDERMQTRFGAAYRLNIQIADMMKQSKVKDPLLLLPPGSYLTSEKITEYPVVEPAVFYYLTGCKAVWYNSPNVQQANCALVVSPEKKPFFKGISNEDLNILIDFYKNYKLDL